MVPILVLATFVVIVLAQVVIVALRRRAAEIARAHSMAPVTEGAPSALPSSDFLFHPGHTWVYVHDDNLVSVGATQFASNFAGHLASVNVPREGARLRQGDSAWTLVSARDRQLRQTMPIDGKVVAVNRELLEDPDLANDSPYEKGWILRVRPRDLQNSIRNLLTEGAARAWIDATQRDRRGFASIVDAGSVILALPSNSELIVFKPSAEAYTELARIKVADTATYAHPVIAGNRIFMKDLETLAMWVIE